MTRLWSETIRRLSLFIERLVQRRQTLAVSAGTDLAPGVASPGFEPAVDFGAVAAATRPVLRGTARAGRTLTCSGLKGARYGWLRDGREVRGATRRTLQLRRADVGRRIACRVTVGATTATSKAVRVRRGSQAPVRA